MSKANDERFLGPNPFPLDDPRYEDWEEVANLADEVWEGRKSTILASPIPAESEAYIDWVCSVELARFEIVAEASLPFCKSTTDLYLNMLDTWIDIQVARDTTLAPEFVHKGELKSVLRMRLRGCRAYYKAEALKLLRETKQPPKADTIPVQPAPQPPLADDEFTITGKNGILRRGQDGFSSFLYKTDREELEITLNQTEARMAEKLWQAAQAGLTVFKSILLKAAKTKDTSSYEQVSKAFSQSGKKAFYKKFVSQDNRGNYKLDREKI